MSEWRQTITVMTPPLPYLSPGSGPLGVMPPGLLPSSVRFCNVYISFIQANILYWKEKSEGA